MSPRQRNSLAVRPWCGGGGRARAAGRVEAVVRALARRGRGAQGRTTYRRSLGSYARSRARLGSASQAQTGSTQAPSPAVGRPPGDAHHVGRDPRVRRGRRRGASGLGRPAWSLGGAGIGGCPAPVGGASVAARTPTDAARVSHIRPGYYLGDGHYPGQRGLPARCQAPRHRPRLGSVTWRNKLALGASCRVRQVDVSCAKSPNLSAVASGAPPCLSRPSAQRAIPSRNRVGRGRRRQFGGRGASGADERQRYTC